MNNTNKLIWAGATVLALIVAMLLPVEAQTPRVVSSWNTNFASYDNANGMLSAKSGAKGTNFLLFGGGHYVPALQLTNSALGPSNGVLRVSSVGGNQIILEDIAAATRLWAVEDSAGTLKIAPGIKDAAGGISNKVTAVSITPTNTMSLGVGMQLSTAIKAVNWTNLMTESVLLYDATSAVLTNTLPSCTNNTGLIIRFAKTDTGGNSVWLVPPGAETLRATIGLVSAWPLNGATNSATVVSSGTNWVLLTGGR